MAGVATSSSCRAVWIFSGNKRIHPSKNVLLNSNILKIQRGVGLRTLSSDHGYSESTAVVTSQENTNLVKQADQLYRERFIPLTRRTTVSYILQEVSTLTESERKDFEKFALSLDAVISTQYAASLQELKQLFDPVSPDKDTVTVRQLTRKDRLDNEFWLLHRLSQLMEKANFYQLSEEEIKRKLVERESHEGIKVSVDTKKYDVLKFWVLGKEQVMNKPSLMERISQSIMRVSPPESSTYYKRVVAAVRLKKDDKLTLKAFKEVPTSDLEKLLPVYSIKIGKFDRYLIYSSVGLASAGVLAKLVTLLAKMSVNWPLIFAGATSLLGVRALWAYKSRQSRYLAKLNQMLYYKNIANNRGLITLVVDRAQDESFKEALLTYTFIYSLGKSQAYMDSLSSTLKSGGVTTISLENAVEDWVYKQTGVNIEFDAAESIAILEKVGILSRHSSGISETLAVLPIEQAHRLLPQTPLSILTRVEESDVTEGYDRSKYDNESGADNPKSSFISGFVKRFRA